MQKTVWALQMPLGCICTANGRQRKAGSGGSAVRRGGPTKLWPSGRGRLPILLIKDIPATIFCPTRTPIFLGFIAVIVAQLFTLLNIPSGNNPEGSCGSLYFTVWITRMVDISGDVVERAAINIPAVVEFKDVRIALY